MDRHIARALAAVATLLAGLAMVPAAALATTPTPVALDAPDNGNSPLVAYDPTTQATYVAWSVPDNQNGGNGVDLCVLPFGQTACEGGGPVLLTDTNTSAAGLGTNSDNIVGLGGLVILPGSNAPVVLGTPVETGTVAWESPAGGSAFLTSGQGLQDGGDLISPVSMFYTTNNAAALNSSDVALFDSWDHFYSYFSDSPVAGPLTPSTLPEDNGNANNGGQFDDQKEFTAGPVIATEPAPPPAPAGTYIVVGVGVNTTTNYATPSGCLNYAATGYGVTVGTAGTSGTLNTQGLQPNGFGLLQCSAEDPVLAQGGQDGIGELEEEGNGVDGAGSTITLDYHPFNATATGGSFGAGVQIADITKHVLVGVDSADLAEDNATGVYAEWTDEQGLVIDYSPDGGVKWGPPVVVPPPKTGSFGDPVIAAVGGGNVLIAFDNNPGTGEQTFLEEVNYQALAITPTTLSTRQKSGSNSGAKISITSGTVGETDTATIVGTNAALAGGTVTYALHSSSGCSPASTVAKSSAAVTAGSAAASAPVTAGLPPGTYDWQASYSGDALNEPSTSPCGSEVLTVNPVATLDGGGTATSTTVTVTITCAVLPCTVTVTITIDPPAAAARAGDRKKKAKIITLAKGTERISKRGGHKLVLKLTSSGKSYVASHSGKLKAALLVSTKTAHGTFKSTGSLKITKRK